MDELALNSLNVPVTEFASSFCESIASFAAEITVSVDCS